MCLLRKIFSGQSAAVFCFDLHFPCDILFLFHDFSLGITSFLNNKIAVIVVPFIIAAVLDTILPTALQPNVAMQPYREGFRIGGYVVLIGIYVIAGSVLLMVSEKWYLKRGTFL